jgi:hypothetical protein
MNRFVLLRIRVATLLPMKKQTLTVTMKRCRIARRPHRALSVWMIENDVHASPGGQAVQGQLLQSISNGLSKATLVKPLLEPHYVNVAVHFIAMDPIMMRKDGMFSVKRLAGPEYRDAER